jgi:hypothetical protein
MPYCFLHNADRLLDHRQLSLPTYGVCQPLQRRIGVKSPTTPAGSSRTPKVSYPDFALFSRDFRGIGHGKTYTTTARQKNLLPCNVQMPEPSSRRALKFVFGPHGIERLNKLVHQLVAVHRRRRESQPLLASRDGRIVYRLHVNRVVAHQSVSH